MDEEGFQSDAFQTDAFQTSIYYRISSVIVGCLASSTWTSFRTFIVQLVPTTYRQVRAATASYRLTRIISAGYRQIQTSVAQYRLVRAITALYRKLKKG